MLAVLGGQDSKLSGNPQKGWTARCPAHEDRTPSFSLAEGNDGRALVYCHRGCTIDQIASALQLDVRDLFEGEPTPIHQQQVVKRYDYRNAAGKVIFRVNRTQFKGFFQQRPDGRGGWINDRKGVPPVLYNLPELMGAKKVVIVEGEKDADALMARGVIATTCPGGAGKWRDEYSPLFRGRTVAIIQDVDQQDPKTGRYPGQEHARQVHESLKRAGVNATLLQPAVGKDVSDHLDAGLKLSQLLPATEPRKPERLEILTAKQIMNLPDPDIEGYLLGPMVYRGHRIVVGGWTGHGKTTFTMYMTAAAVHGKEFLRTTWKGKGDLHALVVDVEQGTRTVKRVLREVGLEHSERVQYLRVPDGLGLDCDEDAIAFMEKTFAHIFRDTGRGYDLVLADPLYKLHRGDPNDTKAATELMRRFDDWRERFGFALILPMHCRKPQDQRGAPKLSPHDLFGSSAYQWGAEMLLGVERKSPGMTWVHWWKDREGDAAEQGATVGSHWPIPFDRQRGFGRYVEGEQQRLPIGEAAPRFDLREYIYEEIRDHGPLTCKQIRDGLWHRRKAGYAPAKIYEALGTLGDRGVVAYETTKDKSKWTYGLQPELLNGTGPGASTGAREQSQPERTEPGGDGV